MLGGRGYSLLPGTGTPLLPAASAVKFAILDDSLQDSNSASSGFRALSLEGLTLTLNPKPL